jgi:hypothetical protein
MVWIGQVRVAHDGAAPSRQMNAPVIAKDDPTDQGTYSRINCEDARPYRNAVDGHASICRRPCAN